MDIEKFQDKWLFQDHTKSEIKNWVKQLHYFYFVRAYGGHSNDGDCFKTAFSYSSKENLVDILSKLGLQVNVLPPDTPRPIAGVSYPAEEFWKFKISVNRFPDLEQPGRTKINSFPCHIYIDNTKINISIAGTKDDDFYTVTTKDFEVCKELEIYFDRLSLSNDKNYEIENEAACVSIKKYPELFG